MDKITQDRPAVVVLSGGQDSTTCLAWAKDQGFSPIYAITIDYGQKHQIEVDAAKKVAEVLGIPPENHRLVSLGDGTPINNITGEDRDVVDADQVTGVLLSTSPLVNPTQEVGQYKSAEALPGGVEPTFVPFRNVLLLTIAANYAISVGAKDIITGICQEDYGGYPDCRENFRSALENTLNLALAGEYAGFHIHAPLMFMSKGDSVYLASRLPGAMDALAYSHTCYNGEYPPNPHNHASILRAKGFREARLPDPLIVRAKKEGKLPEDYPDDGYVADTKYALKEEEAQKEPGDLAGPLGDDAAKEAQTSEGGPAPTEEAEPAKESKRRKKD